MANGAITVPGGSDVRLTDAELSLLRERIDGDEGLTETGAALADVGAGRDVTLPEAERERLCACLDKRGHVREPEEAGFAAGDRPAAGRRLLQLTGRASWSGPRRS